MANAFRSKRLTYRAFTEQDENDYLLTKGSDSLGTANSNPALLKPVSKASIERTKKYLESCLLAVVICLPPSPEEKEKPESSSSPSSTPIGDISLSGSDLNFAHHRRAEIGVTLLPEYQGKGYGSEAIEWILEWGFQRAGLHRIGTC